jgi:hypothetical protein
MDDDRLTEKLAGEVFGWRAAPDRFLKGGRGWMPRWRFAPLERLEDAFQLLDRASDDYTLTANTGSTFSASVRVGERTGTASGRHKARTITLAVAQALGLVVDR